MFLPGRWSSPTRELIGLRSPSKSVFSLFGTLLGASELRTDRPSELSKLATAGIRSASFTSSLDLLVRSHVGLRCLRVQLGSGNLPLVPLGESLVHRPTVQHPAGPSSCACCLVTRIDDMQNGCLSSAVPVSQSTPRGYSPPRT